MSRPRNTLLKELRANIPAKSRLLLAVSGGRDSVAMLAGCVTLADRLSVALEVAHINHNLRANSERDEEFVRALAEKFALPFHVKRLAPSKNPKSIEVWGRKERYRFLNEVRRSSGLDWILTAHNANDVAETFLMRLIRNKELNSIIERDEERKILRPLLNVSRSEINKFIVQERLDYVEDESNADPRFLRNKVRRDLVPILEDFDPRIVEILARRAQSVATDLKLLKRIADRVARAIERNEFGSKEWLAECLEELAVLPSGLGWRVIERLFVKPFGYLLGEKHARRLMKFIFSNGAMIQLPNKIVVRRKAGAIEVIRDGVGNTGVVSS